MRLIGSPLVLHKKRYMIELIVALSLTNATKNENAVTATSKGTPTTINVEECEAVKKAILLITDYPYGKFCLLLISHIACDTGWDRGWEKGTNLANL